MRFPKVHGHRKAASGADSCPVCKILMGMVPMSRGCNDPEGIRNDRACKRCGYRFGYSKAGRVQVWPRPHRGQRQEAAAQREQAKAKRLHAAVLAFRGASTEEHTRLARSLTAPKGVWISANDRETPIGEMATTHLANTLRLLERFAVGEIKRELGALQCLAENIPGAVSPEQFSEIERMTPAAYCEQRVAKYRELSAEGRRRGLKVVNGQTVPRKAATGAKR